MSFSHKGGKTTLHVAAFYGYTTIVSILLNEEDVKPDAKDDVLYTSLNIIFVHIDLIW